MKRKVEMEEDSLFSQTDMAPAKKKKSQKQPPPSGPQKKRPPMRGRKNLGI